MKSLPPPILAACVTAAATLSSKLSESTISILILGRKSIAFPLRFLWRRAGSCGSLGNDRSIALLLFVFSAEHFQAARRAESGQTTISSVRRKTNGRGFLAKLSRLIKSGGHLEGD